MSLVSVIIPAYNREKTIIRAIHSVLVQTHQNFEIIIVDDFSSDNTVLRIEELNNKRIKILKQEKNLGANAARNRGIKAASGDWIAFLDSDDEWLPEHLEDLLNFEKKNSEIGIICSGGYIINEDDKKEKKLPCTKGGYIYKQEIFGDLLMPTSCVAVKKYILEEVGGFDVKLPARQDYDLWLRITKKYELGIVKKCSTIIYWDKHPHIGDSYKRYIIGTKMIVSKLIKDNDISNSDKRKLYSIHYFSIVKSCANAEQYIEAKKYINNVLIYSNSIKYKLINFLLDYPILYKIIRKMKKVLKNYNV